MVRRSIALDGRFAELMEKARGLPGLQRYRQRADGRSDVIVGYLENRAVRQQQQLVLDLEWQKIVIGDISHPYEARIETLVVQLMNEGDYELLERLVVFRMLYPAWQQDAEAHGENDLVLKR